MGNIKIISVKEYVNRSKDETIDFTKDGKCSNCGGCCSNLLPLRDLEVIEIRQYVKINKIKATNNQLAPLRSKVIDLTCPFRSEAENKCTIYSVRPNICRFFLCDNDKAREIAYSKSMTKIRQFVRIVNMRDQFFNEK